MRPRHQPMRTCVGCRTEQPKRQLVRIVRTPDGQVIVDETGKANGRGAYLCRRAACWTQALRRGALAHALRTTIDETTRAALETYRDTLPATAGAATGS